MSRRLPERERETGRFKHTWAWVGADPETGLEAAACQDCERIHIYGQGFDRYFASAEKAVSAGYGRLVGGQIP